MKILSHKSVFEACVEETYQEIKLLGEKHDAELINSISAGLSHGNFDTDEMRAWAAILLASARATDEGLFDAVTE